MPTNAPRPHLLLAAAILLALAALILVGLWRGADPGELAAGVLAVLLLLGLGVGLAGRWKRPVEAAPAEDLPPVALTIDVWIVRRMPTEEEVRRN